jgi:hypothetical protein
MVLILLRLFCIHWFLEGLVILATDIFLLPHHSTENLGMRMGPAIVMLAVPVVGWLAAPKLGRLIAGKYDVQISLPVPPLRDLYAFGFVFLGLYFAIQSLGEAILRFYYALVAAASHGDFDPIIRQQASYDVMRALITLAGGVLCIVFGKRWAAKLADSKAET